MKNLNSDIQASSRIISIINRSKEQYENIINGLENAYVVINEKLEILDANIRFSRIKSSYFFRQNIRSYFHQDSVPLLDGALAEIFSNQRSVTVELKTYNGRLYLFNLSLVSVGRIEEGSIIKLLGTDITDLRESEGLISDVFRSVSLGLVFIDKDSLIMPGHSAFTSMILENFELDRKSIYDVLFYKNIKKLSPDETQTFEDLRTIFGKDKGDFSTITFLAPKILEIPSKMKAGGKKIIQLTLEPIIEDNLVKRYMMILQDMTDILNLNPPKLNDDISKMMKLIIDDFETLRSTFSDIEDLSARIPAEITGKLNDEFKGLFHTIKGMLRLMGLSYLGGLVHELESLIKDSKVDETINYQAIWDRFIVDWKKTKKIFDVFVEKSSAGGEGLIDENISGLINKLNQLPKDISHHLFLSPSVAFADVKFSGFDEVNRSLEGLLIKNIDLTSLDVDLSANYITISSTATSMQAIKSALIHLLNNSFAHGFPGVDHPCQVVIKTRHENGFIILDYIDNGHGIRVDKIRKKLQDENFMDAKTISLLPDEKVAEFIFTSGLTTKDTADEMAGRGEGLSSAALEIVRCGGDLKLLSFTKGCHFQISIPVIDSNLFSPLIINHKIFNAALSVYFNHFTLDMKTDVGNLKLLYPQLFYKALKLLEMKVDRKMRISLSFMGERIENSNSEFLEIQKILSYNNIELEINLNENLIIFYFMNNLSDHQNQIYSRLKELEVSFMKHLKSNDNPLILASGG